MGMDERDYYREKQRHTAKQSTDDRRASHRPGEERSGAIGYLLIPLLALAGLWFGADVFLTWRVAEKHPEPQIVLPDSANDSQLGGALQIKADPQGHFRGSLTINNVAMPFLIDTGATKIVVPEKYAAAAGLRLGAPVQSATAGGRVMDYQTHINSLKLGNIELRNLDAHVNEYVDEVLVGMSALRYFQIVQSGKQLTLTAEAVTSKSGYDGDNVAILSTARSDNRGLEIKKAVVCDQQNGCVTRYSDH